MKYWILITILLSGCTEYAPMVGDCFFNPDYSNAIKITKVEKYGVFLDSINRPPTVWLGIKTNAYDSGAYADWQTFQSFNLRRVDCDAYDIIDKQRNKK
jgi:hypothetical protein